MAWISFSGGLRDKVISPAACVAPLTTHSGQSDVISYHDFLVAMDGAGTIGGRHGEMAVAVIVMLLPALCVVAAFHTNAIMAQTSTRYRIGTSK